MDFPLAVLSLLARHLSQAGAWPRPARAPGPHGLDVNLLLAALFAGTPAPRWTKTAEALLEATVGVYHREGGAAAAAARRALKPLEGGPLDAARRSSRPSCAAR